MRTLALIPARGGSKRIVGKNIKPLNNIPLIGWTANFANNCPHFDQVVLSTDDVDIARVGEDFGLSTLGPRPNDLSTDAAATVDVALFELARAEKHFGAFDAIALLQATTPYRKQKRWDQAYKLLEDTSVNAAIGVEPAVQSPELALWCDKKSNLSPVLPDHFGQRSQSFDPAVFVNGALYLVRVSTLRGEKTFFPKHSKAVICDTEIENIDIDYTEDWIKAEKLLSEIDQPSGE